MDPIEAMKQFKKELEVMKKDAKPGDSIPAEAFFGFMDVLINAFDTVVEENKKLKGEDNGPTKD